VNLQEAEVERTMKVVKGGKVSVVLSEAYYQDVKAGKYPGLEALDVPAELEFDEEGNVITEISK